MKLAAYAKYIRALDWGFLGSEPEDPYFESQYKVAKRVAETSPNHARLWELGNRYHRDVQWKWVTGRKPVGFDPYQAHERTWRWLAAYLWVHGVRLELEEAEKLVGESEGWYHSHGGEDARYAAYNVNWGAIDVLIKFAGK